MVRVTDSIYINRGEERVCQGDVLENFEYELPLKISGDEASKTSLIFPYIIIMSQDCDLERDYECRNIEEPVQDKILYSILICPAFIAETFRGGDHLKPWGLERKSWDPDFWKTIKRNQNQRTYFLRGDDKFKIPDLVVDFIHHYTVTRNSVYGVHKEKYVTSIKDLFRENLSQRFAFYLSRIGLPEVK